MFDEIMVGDPFPSSAIRPRSLDRKILELLQQLVEQRASGSWTSSAYNISIDPFSTPMPFASHRFYDRLAFTPLHDLPAQDLWARNILAGDTCRDTCETGEGKGRLRDVVNCVSNRRGETRRDSRIFPSLLLNAQTVSCRIFRGVLAPGVPSVFVPVMDQGKTCKRAFGLT